MEELNLIRADIDGICEPCGCSRPWPIFKCFHCHQMQFLASFLALLYVTLYILWMGKIVSSRDVKHFFAFGWLRRVLYGYLNDQSDLCFENCCESSLLKSTGY